MHSETAAFVGACVLALFLGFMLGGIGAEVSISKKCSLQGSFIYDNTVYECKQRPK